MAIALDVQALLRKVKVTFSEAFTKRSGDEMPVRLAIEREGSSPVEGTKTSYRDLYTSPVNWDEVQAEYDRLVDGKVDDALGAEIADASHVPRRCRSRILQGCSSESDRVDRHRCY